VVPQYSPTPGSQMTIGEMDIDALCRHVDPEAVPALGVHLAAPPSKAKFSGTLAKILAPKSKTTAKKASDSSNASGTSTFQVDPATGTTSADRHVAVDSTSTAVTTTSSSGTTSAARNTPKRRTKD
jgi:hypothetical protein